MSTGIRSLAGVAHVERCQGAEADVESPATLLVEVPHGADAPEHYEALKARLAGPLPEGLEAFFYVNTDVGAWQLGRHVAQQIVAARPMESALLVRCLLPRTFVDTNRAADFAGSELTKGGMTASVPAYVADAGDRDRLVELHGAYTEIAGRAYEEVCGGGGLAIVPHTYAERSVGIKSVGEDIVAQLEWAYEASRVESWPKRVEVDLLTRDGDGELFAPSGLEEALSRAYGSAGFEVAANDTYYLHPSTQAYVWSAKYRGKVLCFEARRDLLVEDWRPLEPLVVCDEKVARMAGPLVASLLGRG